MACSWERPWSDWGLSLLVLMAMTALTCSQAQASVPPLGWQRRALL